jgi:sporulation-control protein spo0M
LARSLLSASPESAVIEMGTSRSFSLRRWAVTMISPVLASLAAGAAEVDATAG